MWLVIVLSLGVGMVLFMGDSNGIVFDRQLGMELFCFVISIRRVVGRYVLLFDCITSDLFRSTFLQESCCFEYRVEVFKVSSFSCW